MKQEHYGAVTLLLIFGTALFAELLPLASVLCLAGVAGCLIKGELWEFNTERNGENDSSSDR